jgi:hypothetical protein
LFFRPKNEHKTNQRKGRGFLGPFPYFPDLSLFLSLFLSAFIIMDNVYALNERAVRALEDNGITAKTMIRFARLGLYAQIVLALWGSLSFTYGIIHASALAVSLYGVVALELKTPRLLKIYAAVLLALTITDLLWLLNFTGSIWGGRTGVKDQYYDTLSYASLNWTTLFPEFLAFLVRVASVCLWGMLWMKGALNDLEGECLDPDSEGLMMGSGGNSSSRTYVPGSEYQDDFSHVQPAGAVPEGRIRGQGSSKKKGGGSSDDFSLSGAGYQQSEV